MKSLYGKKTPKDVIEEYSCRSEYWISTKYDVRVLDYWRLPNRNFILKLGQDEDLDCETDLRISYSAYLSGFIFSNTKRISNNLIRELGGFKKFNVFYTDTNSLYI